MPLASPRATCQMLRQEARDPREMALLNPPPFWDLPSFCIEIEQRPHSPSACSPFASVGRSNTWFVA